MKGRREEGTARRIWNWNLLCVAFGRGHDPRVEHEEVKAQLGASDSIGEGLDRLQVGEIEREDNNVGFRHSVAACIGALNGVDDCSLRCLHVAAAQNNAAAGKC